MIRVKVSTFVPPEDTVWLIRDPTGLVVATAPGDERDHAGRLLHGDGILALLPELAGNPRKARRKGWTAERVLRTDAEQHGHLGFKLPEGAEIVAPEDSDG